MANKKRHFLLLYELSMHNHQTRRNINQCWLQSNQQFTFRWSVIVSEHSNHSPAHMCGLNFCSATILPKAKLHCKPFEISFDSDSVFPRGFGRINIQDPSNPYKTFEDRSSDQVTPSFHKGVVLSIFILKNIHLIVVKIPPYTS